MIYYSEEQAIFEAWDKLHSEQFKSWTDRIKNNDVDRTIKPSVNVYHIESGYVRQLKERFGVILNSTEIKLEMRMVKHVSAQGRPDSKQAKALPDEVFKALPDYIKRHLYVVWDEGDGVSRQPALIYVLPYVDEKSRVAKAVIRVNMSTKKGIVNSIRSGGLVLESNLIQKGMHRLKKE